MNICLAATLADSRRELYEKGKQNWSALMDRFSDIAIHATETTHQDWFEFFDTKQVPFLTAPSSENVIGLHRRRSLALALETNAERILYADLDHMIRWLERFPDDLDQVLVKTGQYDCLVIERSEESFASSPRRLRETEALVNHIYALITGNNFDLMMATRCFSRAAATHVVKECTEDTIANDVVWPMLCETNGFTVGAVKSNGLRYETNAVYGTDAIDIQDADPRAWIQRITYLSQNVDAMKPYLEKYKPQ